MTQSATRDPHMGPTQGTHTGDPHRGPTQGTHTGDPHRGEGPTEDPPPEGRATQGIRTEHTHPHRTHTDRNSPQNESRKVNISKEPFRVPVRTYINELIKFSSQTLSVHAMRHRSAPDPSARQGASNFDPASHADFGAATHPGVGGGTHRRRATADLCEVVRSCVSFVCSVVWWFVCCACDLCFV